MGEGLAMKIKNIKEGKKEVFERVIEDVDPTITKYVKAIYDGDKDDIREEYLLALWEAIQKMVYVNNDGQCVNYLHRAIENKFHELYRAQKLKRDNEVGNNGELFLNFFEPSKDQYSDVICMESIRQALGITDEKEKDIVYKMFIEEMSDSEIAQIYNVSRQYINRMRRKYKRIIKERLFG